jgi:hypothetical protein
MKMEAVSSFHTTRCHNTEGHPDKERRSIRVSAPRKPKYLEFFPGIKLVNSTSTILTNTGTYSAANAV